MRVVSNQMALLPNGAVEARGPTFFDAAVRAMAKSATWLCAIVFIAGAIEPSGQCVHDQLAGTLVVRWPTWRERDTELDLAGGLGPGTDGVLVPHVRPERQQRENVPVDLQPMERRG